MLNQFNTKSKWHEKPEIDKGYIESLKIPDSKEFEHQYMQKPASAPRCYIAGPITGLPIDQAKEAFDLGERQVEEMGCQPVNPMELPHKHDKSWQAYMKESISALCTCDRIYMIKGWNKSKGARLELDLALSLGISPIYQSDVSQKEIAQ